FLLHFIRLFLLSCRYYFFFLLSSMPVTSVQRVGSSENLRKTALQGGFFVFRARDYAQTKTISRRSSY
ncbi:hypothetical protein NQ069_25300, partial [Escherichia coli]|nr:hypothetical protein [Escherichia coli]